MESKENPVFGRKVFFLDPSLNVRNVVVERLRVQEYEVYILDDIEKAKPVLREFPHAICFINIDDQIPISSWFNFVKSFEFDPTLSTIFLGVLSAKAKTVEREQFLLKTKIPGGFVNLNDNINVVYCTIQKILDINGSKGRRKFVRLDCHNNSEVSANAIVNQRLVNFTMDDVSSCGFAVRVKTNMASLFVQNVDYSVTLHLSRSDIVVKAKVFAIKPNQDDVTIVFILSENTPPEINEEIRKYVFRVLQSNMDAKQAGSIGDKTDYSKEIKIPEAKKSELLSIDDIRFEDLGDLEDIK